MARTERKVRTFDVAYDDADNRVHINMTTVTEVSSGRGREWQQDDRTYQGDALVLTLDEFESLMRAGITTLTYQVGLVRQLGVRVDPRTEKLATPLAADSA